MGPLFYNMLVGALILVSNLGIAQAQGLWMQPNMNSGSSRVSRFPMNRHIFSTVNGHVLSLAADESGEISMEVIGFVPNRQRTRIQTPPATQFRRADNFIQANGQEMMQSVNDGGQVLPSADDQSSLSNVAGTAMTDFSPPDQMAGPNDQTTVDANGFAGSADDLGGVDSVPGNPNIQEQTDAQPDNGPNEFAGSPNTFGDLGSVPSDQNFQEQTDVQPDNEPSFRTEGGFGNQQNSLQAIGGPVNFPSNPPQMGRLQNTIGGIAPSLAGIAHIFRDSDESQDISVERSFVLGQDGRIQSTVQLSRDSNEYDDGSLEVNLNLLPQIRSLLNNQLQTQHQVVSNNPQMVFFQHNDQDNDMSLDFQGILTNPVFQQQIQEIDVRLKRAPAARSKRLMEKYAHALALSSSSTNNTAPATINSSFFLSLLITWISVGLIL
ncbi:uncharacterized protein LOC124313062 isoform X3 [Daphnia pulicaria]|uniref:uncharacterized protein LOC124313062 isoform X2 n=1 Tax=Daphnia pulicaria TaxID=35523 RepID=UPI001EECE4EF|nr:uncharacterized protein LOC124313062 isoform X2 [Daphnia pulicaria]XP_046633725.1 uncharacterized protein LOC124313062 isoform X3 [Daphnia pulicaria]